MDLQAKKEIRLRQESHRQLVTKFQALARTCAASIVADRREADGVRVVRVWRGMGDLFFIPLYFRTKTVFSISTLGSVYGPDSIYARDVIHITSDGDVVTAPFGFQRRWRASEPSCYMVEILEIWVATLHHRRGPKK